MAQSTPASDDRNPNQEKPTQILDDVIRVVNPAGAVGLIGVYIAPDPGAKDKNAKKGIFSFPVANLFDKALSVGTGQALVNRYNKYMRDLIVNGRAKPSTIVSYHIQIDDAPQAYEKFDKRIEGYTKVLIKFGDIRKPLDYYSE